MIRSPSDRDSVWPVSFTISAVYSVYSGTQQYAARDWPNSFPDRKRVPLQQAVPVACLEYRVARRRHILEFWMRYLGEKVRTITPSAFL